MASVCGSTLALMDAGVPIKRPVAGIAMGLVMVDGKYTILTDIQGLEDALGDMDFKVAGTAKGITALQMDIKISGVTQGIMAEALEQALKGRLFILDKMRECIAKPRPELSRYAPRIITMEIPVDQIRDVIGPGGKIIRDIIAKTGVEIDIEDDGRVYIASTDEEERRQGPEAHRALCEGCGSGRNLSGSGETDHELRCLRWRSSRAKKVWCTFPSWKTAGCARWKTCSMWAMKSW